MGILNLDKRLSVFNTQNLQRIKRFLIGSKCDDEREQVFFQPRWNGLRNALQSPRLRKYSWKERHGPWGGGEGSIMTNNVYNYFIFNLTKTKLEFLQPFLKNNALLSMSRISKWIVLPNKELGVLSLYQNINTLHNLTLNWLKQQVNNYIWITAVSIDLETKFQRTSSKSRPPIGQGPALVLDSHEVL